MLKMRLKQELKWYRVKIIGKQYILLGRGLECWAKDLKTVKFWCLFFCILFKNVWKAPHYITASWHLLNHKFLHPHLGHAQYVCIHGSCWGKCEAFRASPGSKMEKKNWLRREALSPWDRFALSPSFIHTASTSPAQPCWWWSRKSQCGILPPWSLHCAWCAGGNWGQKNMVGPDSGRIRVPEWLPWWLSW